MSRGEGSVRDASTVVLLRPAADAAGEPYRIYFVKRHGRSGFLANAHVFPGGKLDPADCDPALHERLDGVDGAAAVGRLGGALDAAVALGLHAAAIREMFEEAGVLLATDGEGRSVRFDGTVGPMAAWRVRLHDGQGTLLDLVLEEGLRLRGAALLPWSRWITPTFEPRRFDTRFFLATLPEGQEPLHDQRETTAGEWLSPTEALEAFGARRIQLAPPTLRTLEELRELPTVEAALAAASSRSMAPITPVAVQEGGVFVLALPGDPAYPGQAGERPDRFTLVDGLWRSER